MNVTLKNGSVIDLRHAAAIRAYADSIRPAADDYVVAYALGGDAIADVEARWTLARHIGGAARMRGAKARAEFLVRVGAAS